MRFIAVLVLLLMPVVAKGDEGKIVAQDYILYEWPTDSEVVAVRATNHKDIFYWYMQGLKGKATVSNKQTIKTVFPDGTVALMSKNEDGDVVTIMTRGSDRIKSVFLPGTIFYGVFTAIITRYRKSR